MIFGASLTFCFAASTLFHAVVGPESRIETLGRIDHVGIHILIAGTYTPLAWELMRGRWRWVTLVAAWALAALGTLILVVHGMMHPVVHTIYYLLLGWGGLACYLQIASRISRRVLRPIWIGGVLYSVGAVLNLLHWPVIWPGVISAHEVFHLFVMAGSLAHFWFILTVVAPMNSMPAPEPAPIPIDG